MEFAEFGFDLDEVADDRLGAGSVFVERAWVEACVVAMGELAEGDAPFGLVLQDADDATAIREVCDVGLLGSSVVEVSQGTGKDGPKAI